MRSNRISHSPASRPLLGVEVWEHAHDLKYQNRQDDYLSAFMDVINWEQVSRRYQAVA